MKYLSLILLLLTPMICNASLTDISGGLKPGQTTEVNLYQTSGTDYTAKYCFIQLKAQYGYPDTTHYASFQPVNITPANPSKLPINNHSWMGYSATGKIKPGSLGYIKVTNLSDSETDTIKITREY